MREKQLPNLENFDEVAETHPGHFLLLVLALDVLLVVLVPSEREHDVELFLDQFDIIALHFFDHSLDHIESRVALKQSLFRSTYWIFLNVLDQAIDDG